jgi:hypothetical protein
MLKWKDVTICEVKTYFDLQIYMGIKKIPDKNYFWSKNEILFDSFISNQISRDRYDSINKYLHFCDNDLLELSEDPLFKLRGVIEILEKCWLFNYIPEENICIDETIIPFRSRVRI